MAEEEAAEVKSPYPPAAATPVLIGPGGIRFDFNLGCRVLLPQRETGNWRVRLRDLDTGNILFESENKGAFVNSAKRWYVRFRVEVWSIEDGATSEPIAGHDARLRPAPSGRPHPVPDRHSGRHPGVVSLCRALRGSPSSNAGSPARYPD